jgi:hypothetical protein
MIDYKESFEELMEDTLAHLKIMKQNFKKHLKKPLQNLTMQVWVLTALISIQI